MNNKRSVPQKLDKLTRKFLAMLRDSPDSVDLKEAADKLNLGKKRRIYDVTNVLEGIGLIEKKGTNTIRLVNTETRSVELKNAYDALQKEQNHLKKEEEYIKRLCKITKSNIKHIRNDKINLSFAYVTRDDLIKSFDVDSSIIVIKNHQDISSNSPVVGTGDLLRKITYPSSHEIRKKLPVYDFESEIINEKSLHVRAPEYCKLDVKLVTRDNETFSQRNDKKLELNKHNNNIRGVNNAEKERIRTANIILGHFRDDENQSKFIRNKDFIEYEFTPALIDIDLPNDSDYLFCLHDSEGIGDLFDIPQVFLNSPITLKIEKD